MRWLPVLLGAGALWCGCSTPMAQLKQEIGPRASRYLECDAASLGYEELERLISTTRVRVSGCDKTAVYRLQESQWTLEQGGR